MNPYLDIEIDRLTNSIEHSVTGEAHDTLISRVLNTNEAVILPDEWRVIYLHLHVNCLSIQDTTDLLPLILSLL